MTFDFNAYEKVYPRSNTPTVTTESAVDGYNPTADEANGSANAADLQAVANQAQPDKGAEPPKQAAQPPQGINTPSDGTAGNMGTNQPPQGTQPDTGGKGEN